MSEQKQSDLAIKPPPVRPFPYWPPTPTDEEMKRLEIMNELNKWANNDTMLAKRSAETLIVLLAHQFDINLLKIEP
jgi:hypothetical protein